MNLAHVEAFVEVARRNSFSGAARALGLPTSSISRAVAGLEQTLSGKLFERTSRRIALTSLGHAFLEHATRALSELAEGERRAHELERDPRGEVRLSSPTDLDDGFLAQSLARFTEAYPRIRIVCVLDNRYVDLVGERFDLALRVADALPDSSLVARPLGRYRAHLVAARSYLARRGTPRHPSDLSQHDCVLTHADDGAAHWALEGPGGQEQVEVRGRLVAGDLHFARALVRAGAGIGVRALAPPHRPLALEPGIVRVLPRYTVRAPGLFLVVPSTKRLPSRVALLRDHLLRAYAT